MWLNLYQIQGFERHTEQIVLLQSISAAEAKDAFKFDNVLPTRES